MSKLLKKLRDRRSGSRKRTDKDGTEVQDTAEASSTAASAAALPVRKSLADYFPNKQTLGLQVLQDSNTARVDIIFIHGRMGNAYKTWVDDKTGVYWPVDLLAKKMTDARILSFGYDADVVGLFSSVGQNTLRGHADSLLGQLGDLRDNPNKASDRKIIIVVHSLGGLVAKKALCVSKESPHTHLRQLHQHTQVVLFLGTPHRGSDLAPRAKHLATFFKLVGGRAVNPRILEPLLRNSQILEEVENDFGNWLRSKGEAQETFKLTCFFEDLQYPGLGFIVSKESATISGFPGPYAIHANHMQMAKFGASDDRGFLDVHGQLKRWARSITKPPASEHSVAADLNAMLRSLAFKEMDTRRQEVDMPSVGTCAWLFRHRNFTSFCDNGGLLWVTGKPGSGKSTLMRKIVQWFQQQSTDKDYVVASFFFNGRGSSLQQSLLGLFRSVLHQLSQSIPALASKLIEIFSERESRMGSVEDKWDWSVAELREMFIDHFRNSCLEKRTWIFLDALDEAGESQALELVGLLRSLLPTDAHSTSAIQNLGICFSCRHYPIVFTTSESSFLGVICLELENGQDIATFSREQLPRRMNQTEAQELCKFIGKRADEVFLWARLVLENVLLHQQKYTFKQMRQKIEGIPAQIEDFYMEKLQDMENDENTQGLHIIQWVYFAARPLTLADLRIALLLDSKRPEKTLSECMEAPDYFENSALLRNAILDRTRGLTQIASRAPTEVTQLLSSFINSYPDSESTTPHCGSDMDFQGDEENDSHGSTEIEEEKDIETIPRPPDLKYKVPEYEVPEDLCEVQLIHQTVSDFLQKHAGKLGIGLVQSNCQLFRSCMKFMSFPEYRSIDIAPVVVRGKGDLIPLNDPRGAWTFGVYATRFWYIHAKAAEDDLQLQKDFMRLLYTFSETDALDYWWSLYLRVHRCFHTAERYNKLDELRYVARNSMRTFLMRVEGSCRKHSLKLLYIFACCGFLSVLDASRDFDGILADANDEMGATLLHWAARHSQGNLVRWILSKEAFNPNQRDSQRRTPFYWLLSMSPPISSWENNTVAVMETFLQDPRIDINLPTYDGYTPLHKAVKHSKQDELRVMLAQSRININPYDQSGWTPLDLAIRDMNSEALELLFSTNQKRLSIGVAKSSTTCSKQYAYYQFIEALMGSEDCLHDSLGSHTVLHFAAWKNHEDLCQFLLASGFDPNLRDECDREPIHLAAGLGHLRVVSLLMSSGSNLCTRDIFGHQPVHKAVINDHIEVAQRIAQAQQTADSDVRTPLLDAILQGHTKCAHDICVSETNFEITCRDNTNLSLRKDNILSRSVVEGDLKMVQTSIRYSTLEREAPWLGNSLYKAVTRGHIDIVRLLLEHGANVNTRDRSSLTVLHEAVRRGSASIAKLLLETGANIDARSRSGLTALQEATRRGSVNITRLLLENGADADAQGLYQQTVLHNVVKRGSANLLRLLLEHGANIDARDCLGQTALHIAAQDGNLQSVAVLADHQANLDARCEDGLTPLHLAALFGHLNVVQKLVNLGADLSAKTGKEETALCLAEDSEIRFWLGIEQRRRG